MNYSCALQVYDWYTYSTIKRILKKWANLVPSTIEVVHLQYK